MGEKSNSSFIPKKPLTKFRQSERRDPTASTFYSVSLGIFLVSIVASLAVFGYGAFLSQQIQGSEEELREAATTLESPELSQYRTLDTRLKEAEGVVNDHTSTSLVFDALSDITLGSVRYTNFELTFGESSEQSNTITREEFESGGGSGGNAASATGTVAVVNLGGEAQSFDAVTRQEEQFRESDLFESVQFSELGLSQGTSLVTFTVVANVDPEQLSYASLVADSAEGSDLSGEIENGLSGVRSQAETLYSENGSYAGVCEMELLSDVFAINEAFSGNCAVSEDGEQWAAWIGNPESGGVYCQDNDEAAVISAPDDTITSCTVSGTENNNPESNE